MKNTLRLNHETRAIVMDRTFAKFAANTMSPEYAHLQRVRMDYPTYTVKQRHIKTKPGKESYRGLTYTYMEHYIELRGTKEDMKVYEEMKLISECHSKSYRYPVIKNWFLERYPEIKQFGVKEDAEHREGGTGDDAAEETNNITELPVAN